MYYFIVVTALLLVFIFGRLIAGRIKRLLQLKARAHWLEEDFIP